MSSVLVSVVTPFHDTDEYLAECIESVLAQDYTNFEYVLVDNASTDNSLAIARKYAERDPRIRVERTDRLLTQIENYNFALRHISSESTYCKIVQADDWIFPRCLTEMVELAVANPNCGVISAYELSGTKVFGDFMDPSERVVDGLEAGRRFMTKDFHLFGSPTTVMYRADLVRARPDFYETGRLHEDTEVVFELLLQSDLGFVPQVLTYTRRQPGSILDLARPKLTHLLDQLIVVTRYGPDFLSPDEFTECRARKRRAYYRAVGRRALKGRRSTQGDFWDYQRTGLATIGERLNKWEIVRSLPGAILERLIPAFGRRR